MTKNTRQLLKTNVLVAVLGLGLSFPAFAVDISAHQRLLLRTQVAQGVQSYKCTPEGVWKFSGPMAILYDPLNRHVVHYSGPSWQFQDGSSVVGRVIASTPHEGTIPELLLEVAAHGQTQGLFQDVKYIRRLATVGGVAPGHCDPRQDTNGLNVPYSAVYEFWGTRADLLI
jgi:hypothetical protein